MGMPQEEIKKQQEQTASGGEGPGREIPSGGLGFLMPYLLQRLDGIGDSINSRIDRLDGKIGAVESNLRGEMNSRLDSMETNLRGEMSDLHRELHSTTRWIIGTIIAVVGVAVAVMRWLN